MTDKYTDYSRLHTAMTENIYCVKPLSTKEKEELKLRISIAIGEGISKA